MPKITKRAEVLDKLNQLIVKEAEVAQTNISGAVLSNTDPRSVSEETEHTDKNDVGPDKLNDEQGYKQEKAEHEPTDGAVKSGAEQQIDKLASEILASIQNKLKEKQSEEAQKNIKGEPAADVVSESVSESTEHTDKNNVGPDKLDKEQGYEQKKTDDKSEPVAKGKKAEAQSEVEKQAAERASYQLGQQFCETLLKKTAEFKEMQEKQAALEMVKEAGRRDFDTLIAQAAAELEQQQGATAFQEKQAEDEGARAFDELYKQAQLDAVAEENKNLRTKLAEYDAHVRRVQYEQEKIASVQREEALASKVASIVLQALKSEPAPATTK